MIKGKLPNTQAGFLVDFINNEDNDSTFESFINENF